MHANKIRYRKQYSSGFYDTLKQRVNEVVRQREKSSRYTTGVRVAFISALYIFFFIQLYTGQSTLQALIAYAALGVLTTAILLNIVHDAVHNTLFRKKAYNKIAILWMEVMGTDAYIWKKRHLTYHHSYPNIINQDSDLRQSVFIRVIPHAPFKKMHRYQPFYMPLLYLFFTLNWFFSRDFTDAFVFNRELRISKMRVAKLFVQKSVYLFVYIILPHVVSGLPLVTMLSGFLLMHSIASILGVFALTTSHVNHDSCFPVPDENGMMPDTWAEHQLKVTQDFGTDNFLINNFFGGFNYHVAHHLFPSVDHRYYQSITPVIHQTAMEFGLDYKCKSFSNSLVSHYKLLIKNSHPVEIDL
jgi:linoleoyl-CoA desaturase